MTHRGEILVLSDGHIVTVDPKTDGHHAARILWAPEDSSYPAGGHDISITARDIAEAHTVQLSDDLAAALVAEAKPTYESQLVVIGEKFKAPNPDDTDEDPEQRLWTISRERGYWTFECTDEEGVTADFDYREIQKNRSIHLIVESIERGVDRAGKPAGAGAET